MKIKAINISARLWRDKQGTTYFTAKGYINGVEKAHIKFQYGYGDHYIDAVDQRLQDLGLLPKRGRFVPLHKFCVENGIELSAGAVHVRKRTDMYASWNSK